MKKWNLLTLLAVLTLLTVPAQAVRTCPGVAAAPRWNVTRRCPPRPDVPGLYVPGCPAFDADSPDVCAPANPAQTPDAPPPVVTPSDEAPAPVVTPSGDAAAVPTTDPAPAQTVQGLSAYETEVVRLVNEVRARYGLSSLEADAELSRVARYKSQDMRDKGYFSHESPTYGTPFQMMKSFGISYRTAGENIAYGYRTPQDVMSAWMNSDGHRANILNASYTRIGVGYVADGDYWTQMFTG